MTRALVPAAATGAMRESTRLPTPRPFAPVAGPLPAHDFARVRVSRQVAPVVQRAPTGIKVADSKPFGHADLKTDELKTKHRTYLGATILMQATPAGDYTKHTANETLTEVANTCPARFTELRSGDFCTGHKALDFNRWGSAGDASTGKMVTDGPDTFIDRHRTHNPESLLEGTGKNECSVVCHQRYKYGGATDLGSFYVIRNFRADKYTPPGATAPLHITTGEVRKVPAALASPSKDDFAKSVAPGLKTSGDLLDPPPAPKAPAQKQGALETDPGDEEVASSGETGVPDDEPAA